MDERLSQALSALQPSDIRLDSVGRVVISRPEVVESLKQTLNPPVVDDLAAAGNGICCGNTGCLSDPLVKMLERLSSGTRIQ